MLFAGGGPNVSGAKIYIQQNELDKAIEVLQKELSERDPNNEDAWYLLGYIYARQKNFEKMIEAFDKAVELKPKFAEEGLKVSKDSGKKFFSQFGRDMIVRQVWGESFNDAVNYFNEGLNAAEEEGPDISQVKEGMSAEMVKQAIGPPLEINVSMVGGVKKEQWVYGGSSYVYVAAGKVDGLQYTEKTVDRKVGFFELAVKNFRNAAVLQPDSLMAYRNWAASLMNIEKYEDCIEPLQEALKRAPEDGELRLLLATSYLHSGKRTEAIDTYMEALEREPDNFKLLADLGTLILEDNQYEAALEYLERAHAIDSESPALNYQIGAAYMNMAVATRDSLPEDSEDTTYKKDYELALPYFEKSLMLNGEDLSVWSILGRLAGQLDKFSLAGFAFSKGEQTESVLEDQVQLGMNGAEVKALLGDPDEVKPLESETFSHISEWIYKKRAAAAGKLAIELPLNVYVKNDKVDALMVFK
jgi:tetratricopeptide (TPR) repeat protein